MKRISLLTTTLLLTTAPAFAKPVYLNVLNSQIPNAHLLHRCQTCHQSGGPQLNAFGKDFAKMKQFLGPSYSSKFWIELKDRDSDLDKVSNQDEILAGCNPGVAEL